MSKFKSLFTCLSLVVAFSSIAWSQPQPTVIDIHGDAAGDRLGRDGLFLPGDLDGDGVPDLVAVGQSHDGPAGNQTGIVRAISGATRTVLFDVHGDAISDRLGGVSRGDGLFLPGDLNADGVPDLVVLGEGVNGPAGTDTGIVRAISGETGAVLYDVYGSSSADLLGLVFEGNALFYQVI